MSSPKATLNQPLWVRKSQDIIRSTMSKCYLVVMTLSKLEASQDLTILLQVSSGGPTEMSST